MYKYFIEGKSIKNESTVAPPWITEKMLKCRLHINALYFNFIFQFSFHDTDEKFFKIIF